ncbi:hypothetical protein [Actinokineospora globicatena]|uniref:Uncharacterized protein n=1 Tax=Actinokineospora globicatena TaxID=103729 RepID=A0A9W6QKP0_9PSEU|nr:hypothetical protein [Actinokineospora globicatena]GLW91425.1 hypothetical protein Aglo03_22410 [Actinokineospora globicatena]
MSDPVLAGKVNDLTVNGTWPSFVDPITAGRHLAAQLTKRDRALLALGLTTLPRADQLISLTGHWAILLSLVNSAVRQSVATGVDPAAAVGEVIEHLHGGPDGLDLASRDGREHAVSATITASTSRVAPTDRDRFLELGVFPEDTDIPIDLVQALWSTSDKRLLRTLVDLSLVTRHGDTIRVHDVLRTYLRRTLGPSLPTITSRLVDLLLAEVTDWSRARAYTLRHLSTHAAEVGRLDPLLVEVGFLLAASQPELLACLPAAHTARAKAAARVYQRAAHNLRDRPPAEHAAYLELTARRQRVTWLADAAGALAENSPWRCLHAEWAREVPHKILTRSPVGVVDAPVALSADGRL